MLTRLPGTREPLAAVVRRHASARCALRATSNAQLENGRHDAQSVDRSDVCSAKQTKNHLPPHPIVTMVSTRSGDARRDTVLSSARAHHAGNRAQGSVPARPRSPREHRISTRCSSRNPTPAAAATATAAASHDNPTARVENTTRPRYARYVRIEQGAMGRPGIHPADSRFYPGTRHPAKPQFGVTTISPRRRNSSPPLRGANSHATSDA